MRWIGLDRVFLEFYDKVGFTCYEWDSMYFYEIYGIDECVIDYVRV
jgi:hypothetical protein